MPKENRAGFGVGWTQLSHGPSPALLLHCALAHSGAYAALALALGDALAIVAPDMPSHGRSDPWDGRCNIHDQVTASAATFLQPGTHVIGHSFGATVALRLAQMHAQQVARLTLIEPVLFAAAREIDPDLYRVFAASDAETKTALAQGHWEAAAISFTSSWGDGRPWNALSARQKNGIVQRMPVISDTDACLHEDTAGLLADGQLESINCPTHLIRGSETMPIVVPIHAALRRRITGSTETVIDGAGHMLPLSHPQHVAAAILAQ